jgi:ethanolamine phosphate transferase 2 subunit G
MPRVKAITTGSVPSFLDAILNFAESDTTSTLANVDNWLAQIKAGNRGGEGRLLMYGDDTWLKVFPDMFYREDGTSSFFVSVSEIASAGREAECQFLNLGFYGSGSECD